MSQTAQRTVLCLSSYFKGNRFIQRCKREGCRVYLLTVVERRDAPWARDHLDDVFLLPTFDDHRGLINAVAYLMRSIQFDVIAALDDYDVELGALLREHFRLPGLGDSLIRHFRDKLAMRCQARACGFAVPDFVGLFHDAEVKHFLETVPAPWLIKPRTEASSIGIKKCHQADEVWHHIESLGDQRSFNLLERFITGDLYHVDSLVVESKVVFAEVGQYHRPLLEVYQGGGIFSSKTVERERTDAVALRAINEKLLPAFGMERGCSHTEFIHSKEDGAYYFVETSARVGGAGIADMVEAATGLNLWEEWAAIEISVGKPYQLPTPRREFGGVIASLARQEKPDTTPFADPEVFLRMDEKHHIGLVVRSANPQRVEELLDQYSERIKRDYHVALPPADRATS